MKHVITVGKRKIGPGHPTFIIAELSGNHHQDKTKALELIHAAHEAGVDAIKSQVYTPATITVPSRLPPYIINHPNPEWNGKTLYELYGQAYTPWKWMREMKALTEKLGMVFFASEFDPTAVDFMEKLKVAVHKIASFELVDIPLIKHMARTGKPLILSTGMATLAEIDEAVSAARSQRNEQIILLWCKSDYPSKPELMRLRTIPHLAKMFSVPVGLSDHTLTLASAISAVSLGATLVEKHIIMSRQEGGPDSAFSLEPAEFKQLVTEIRNTEKALGTVRYGPTSEELKKSIIFRRSLIAVKNIKAGEKITVANVRSKRPGNGLLPKHLPNIIGHTITRTIPLGTPITWDLIGGKPTIRRSRPAHHKS